MSEISSTLLTAALTKLPATVTAAGHAFAISTITGIALGCMSWDVLKFGDLLWKKPGLLAGWVSLKMVFFCLLDSIISIEGSQFGSAWRF